MPRQYSAAADTRTLIHSSLFAGLVLLAGCSQSAAPPSSVASAASATPGAAQDVAASGSYTPPSAAKLYQLVGPIALFPDSLVAQVLAGSTYPQQIAAAEQLLAMHPGLGRDALRAQVDPQRWDPSVKALTTFPSVLDQMASNAAWTQALGVAYANDPTDVMNAIQVLRQRAQQSGNLHSTAQQVVQSQPQQAQGAPYPTQGGAGDATTQQPVYQVVQAPAQVIEILPAQSNVVYVPSYDPAVVYGTTQYVFPGYRYLGGPRFSTGEVVAAGAVTFGAGILIGALLEHHHDSAWRAPPGGGWHSWGINWGGRGPHGDWQRPAVIHNNNVYVTRNTTVINRNIYNRNVANRNTFNRSAVDTRTASHVQNVDNRSLANRDAGHHAVEPPMTRAPQRSTVAPMTMPHFDTALARAPKALARPTSAAPTAHFIHSVQPRVAAANATHTVQERRAATSEPPRPAASPRTRERARADADLRRAEPQAAAAPYRQTLNITPPRAELHEAARSPDRVPPQQHAAVTAHRPVPHAVAPARRDANHTDKDHRR